MQGSIAGLAFFASKWSRSGVACSEAEAAGAGVVCEDAASGKQQRNTARVPSTRIDIIFLSAGLRARRRLAYGEINKTNGPKSRSYKRSQEARYCFLFPTSSFHDAGLLGGRAGHAAAAPSPA